ncbi:MAG: hypothetical protein CMO34_03025 [Verrucomicrobia bacterium]|nr:hypothetical protein [Verrucomicrobiota bacterium]
MKNTILLSSIILLIFVGISKQAVAQNERDLQYFRPPGLEGVNQFETTKDSATVPFTGVKVRVGGDFAIQFQGIDHSTESTDTLATLGNNFNLPTANLNLDVQLADGVRMSLVTYLSSRNHSEAWVKGGYIQIDKLDFIRKDYLKEVMKVVTIKAGMDEINYGDAHFRRTDNARAIYNPFVGNYLMDAFTTEPFAELYFQKHGFLAMAGISNGKLNQSVVKGTKEPKPSVYGKVGYDKQLNDDFRFRLTASLFNSPGYDNGQYLYSGDRAGARYYNVMQLHDAQGNFRSGRFSPGFWKYSAFQLNPFVKWKGLEFFGIYELVNGDQSETATEGSFTQIGAELLYRIGEEEKFFLGGRYNQVSGEDTKDAAVKTIDRLNIGGGWFMTDNVMVKAEYVNQSYSDDGWIGTVYQGGNFNGVMMEAAISF